MIISIIQKLIYIFTTCSHVSLELFLKYDFQAAITAIFLRNLCTDPHKTFPLRSPNTLELQHHNTGTKQLYPAMVICMLTSKLRGVTHTDRVYSYIQSVHTQIRCNMQNNPLNNGS